MSDPATEDAVLRAIGAERANVMFVGPAAATTALLARAVASLGPVHAVVITTDPAPTWATSEVAHVSARPLEAGAGPQELAQALRAALRQDPDVLALQAPAGALPWALLLTAAETGHQVLAHLTDAADEGGPLAAARDAAGMDLADLLRAAVVLDEAGLARVAGPDGEIVWRRGEAPLARLPGGRDARRAAEALAFLRQEVERERTPLLVVGPEPAASATFAGLVAPLGGQHAIALPARADAAWARGLGLVMAWGEHGLEALVRACLRQDPDALVVEAPAVSIPWLMLMQAALTGHQLVVRVDDARDEAALEGLRAAAREQGLAPAVALPWLVVVDELGVERLVGTDGARGDAPETVWRRDQPLPERLRDLLPRATSGSSLPEEPALEPLDPALVERVRARVEPLLRAAFVPASTPASGDAACSKLGGAPMLAPGEAWPACACGRPMPLAVQLARGELPQEAQVCFPGGAGWLQLFYCSSTSCSVEDGWEAAAPNKRLRFLAQDGAIPATSSPAFEDAAWAPHDITGWQRVEETPATDDLEDLDDAARDDRWALASRCSSDDDALDDELARLAGPLGGDKLLGWPCWEQAPGWQRCPRCAARMEPLVQLDAYRGRLEMLFAADGTGHVTQCPTHLDELAFVWACG